MNRNKTKEVILAGEMIGLGIIIPILFHYLGGSGAGRMFLPMHIPVIIGGFILSPVFALIVGIITPLLSSVITGMPVLMPMGIIMMFELGCYGLVASLFFKKFNTYITLILTMIIGRLFAGIVVYILTSFIGIKFAPPIIYVKTGIITGIPGIIIQLILIPTILVGINKYKNKLSI